MLLPACFIWLVLETEQGVRSQGYLWIKDKAYYPHANLVKEPEHVDDLLDKWWPLGVRACCLLHLWLLIMYDWKKCTKEYQRRIVLYQEEQLKNFNKLWKCFPHWPLNTILPLPQQRSVHTTSPQCCFSLFWQRLLQNVQNDIRDLSRVLQ